MCISFFTFMDFLPLWMFKDFFKYFFKNNKQIETQIKEKHNKIVSGDAQKVKIVLDTWKFSKDITSRNPNWLIVDTQA